MLIDRKTGAVNLGSGGTIMPRMSRRQFEETGLIDLTRAPDSDGPSVRYHLRPIPAGDHWWRSIIYFHGQRLQQLSLHFANTQELGSWESWSQEEQAQTKSYHEALLRADLGEPHRARITNSGVREDALRTTVSYKFAWGEVVSGYDAKASTIHLTITFKRRFLFF